MSSSPSDCKLLLYSDFSNVKPSSVHNFDSNLVSTSIFKHVSIQKCAGVYLNLDKGSFHSCSHAGTHAVIDSFMSLSGSHLFISLWYSLLVMSMPRVARVTLKAHRNLLEAEHLKERFDILNDNYIFLPIVAEN